MNRNPARPDPAVERFEGIEVQRATRVTLADDPTSA